MIFLALAISLLSFGLTWISVMLLRHWAPSLGTIDIPNDRSSHSAPTPRGGGLPIVAAVLTGVTALAIWRDVLSPLTLFTWLGAGVIVATIGWMDDRRSLSPRLRLLAHIAAALLTILGAGAFGEVRLPFVGSVVLGWVGVPLTLLWIVGLTNAYNFMDGIDGLAAGQAVVGGIFWTIIGWQTDIELIIWAGILISSASFGFLLHNWPPAQIFMGDVASGFLGFSFASLGLMANHVPNREPFFGIGALLLSVFVFDSGYTFLRRVLKRESVFKAHRSHLYQRLIITGLSHSHVTAVYMMLSLLTATAGMLYFGQAPFADYVAVSTVVSMSVLLLLWTRRRESHLTPEWGG